MCFFGHTIWCLKFTSLQFKLYYCIKVICLDYWQKYVKAWIAYLIINVIVTAAVQFQIRVNACDRRRWSLSQFSRNFLSTLG